jgi:hypothetical protein
MFKIFWFVLNFMIFCNFEKFAGDFQICYKIALVLFEANFNAD